jgi:hypothetical protein
MRSAAAAVMAAVAVVGTSCTGAADAERTASETTASTTARTARDLVEVPPSSPDTPEQRAAAEQLRQDVLATVALRGWRDVDQVAADGFVPMTLDPSHWYQPEFVADGRTFDPAAPEFLVVDGRDVVGVMFLAEDPSLDQPDPVGAPWVRWHFHEWAEPVCLEGGLVVIGLPEAGRCPTGSTMSDRSPLMAHVWIVDTDDPFASEMDGHEHR